MSKCCPLCHGAGIVREPVMESLCNPELVYAALVRKGIHRKKQEHFIALQVDTQNQIIGMTTVSLGTVDGTVVHSRDVFREAIKKNAYAVILAHNHPSGILSASEADLETTRNMVQAGRLLGIQVIDHLIITKTGYRSLRESVAHGWIFEQKGDEDAE